jgi:G6PDH family F420-dependent oxidoreductase
MPTTTAAPFRIGYALSSEEHSPNDLIAHAKLAEQAGFEFLAISDHFHPWIDRQGHSPFVWSVLGALAHETSLDVATGVTCPIGRIHPVILAQATATVAAMMPGRFRFGVGTGEALNEHITGDVWPDYELRAEMLEEAIELIRELWKGEQLSHYGEHFTVVNARIYDTPPEPVPVIYAASGPKAAEAAGRLADAMVITSADKELVQAFRGSGGRDKPIYGQVTVCWGRDEATAKEVLREIWPTGAIEGMASQELPLPLHFEQLTKTVTADQLAEHTPCGPDIDRHVANLREYLDAGVDHVYVHQVGPDQQGFIEAYAKNVLPQVRGNQGGRRKAASAA